MTQFQLGFMVGIETAEEAVRQARLRILTSDLAVKLEGRDGRLALFLLEGFADAIIGGFEKARNGFPKDS